MTQPTPFEEKLTKLLVEHHCADSSGKDILCHCGVKFNPPKAGVKWATHVSAEVVKLFQDGIKAGLSAIAAGVTKEMVSGGNLASGNLASGNLASGNLAGLSGGLSLGGTGGGKASGTGVNPLGIDGEEVAEKLKAAMRRAKERRQASGEIPNKPNGQG